MRRQSDDRSVARVHSAIQRKLLRDLARLKGQVGTIAVVLACGIGSVIALRGTLVALRQAQDAFYERQRFADVFASLERAPNGVRGQLESIPGVARIQTRVKDVATIPLESVSHPIRAEVIGLPTPEDEALNAISVQEGRRPLPGRDDEIVLLAGFAAAQRMRPGDRLRAVISGHERTLQIVGTAVSPEYVVAMAPGAMSAEPDRFAVIWMNPDAAARALRMEGAFNDVAFVVAPGASTGDVIDAADRLLERYGGRGAYERSRQTSEHMVQGELSQLRGMATIMPGVFLGVSALLVNLVLSRLVRLQQPEIATLKALGYSGAEVGLHFLEFALVVATLGGALGTLLGSWIGNWMVGIYGHFFKFPGLAFHTDWRGALFGTSIGYGAATFGALAAVARVVRLAPAEAMQPPTPARYRRSWLDAAGLSQWLGPTVSMIRRELTRRPLRTLASSAAIAASTALCMVGAWHYDGIRALVALQFEDVMREDLNVTFIRPVEARAIRALAHLPSVRKAEGLRMAPVRFVSRSRTRDGVLVGYEPRGELRTPRDRYGRPVALSDDGVVMTEILASLLELAPGDLVTVEVKEGRRMTVPVRIAGTVDDGFGLQGHMTADGLNRLLGEAPAVSLGLLSLEGGATVDIDERLKRMPGVLTVTSRAQLVRDFEEQSGSMLLTSAIVITLFAATITIGVVYNNARAALSARARDLASLRILGFTRREVSSVLLGEIAIQVLLAIPFGLIAGRALVQWMASTTDPESYRMPLLLGARTYAFSALVTIAAALLSGLVVRRRIDRLDLISVLKARE